MKLLEKIRNIVVQKRIDNAKYVHFMFNDKFNKAFVDFLNKNFDIKEHLVLCKRWYNEHPFPEGKNVIEVQSFKNFFFKKNEKLICHSLFDGELVEYLYNHQDILKNKAYWCIWGGDLYNAPRDEKNDFVRKKIKAYVSVAQGDEVVAKNKYKSETKILSSAPYLSPQVSQKDNYDFYIANPLKNNETRIQINNSCDESILEMLDILSKFKDENIKITTILSYGKIEIKDKIIKKGQEIFADKFEFIEKFLPIEEFIKYSASNNILICNQNRQQGLGNVLSSLYLGNKVFIKSDITSVKYLENFGLKVFDTYKISEMSFDEFKKYLDDIRENNIKMAEKFYTEDLYIKKWNEIFEL